MVDMIEWDRAVWEDHEAMCEFVRVPIGVQRHSDHILFERGNL